MKKMLYKKNMDPCHLDINIQHCPSRFCYPIFHLQRGMKKRHAKVGTDNAIVMLFFDPHPQLTSSGVAT